MVKIFLCVYGQKWVRPVWSRDSKMTRRSKVIFPCWYKFRKAKSWFNYFWVGVVKSGYGFLVCETLISVVRMNLSVELIFWMLIVTIFWMLIVIPGVYCSCTSCFIWTHCKKGFLSDNQIRCSYTLPVTVR